MVTDIFLVNICFLTLNIAHTVQKLSKTQEKHTAERLFLQPKCEDTETHAAAYTEYTRGIHVK